MACRWEQNCCIFRLFGLSLLVMSGCTRLITIQGSEASTVTPTAAHQEQPSEQNIDKEALREVAGGFLGLLADYDSSLPTAASHSGSGLTVITIPQAAMQVQPRGGNLEPLPSSFEGQIVAFQRKAGTPLPRDNALPVSIFHSEKIAGSKTSETAQRPGDPAAIPIPGALANAEAQSARSAAPAGYTPPSPYSRAMLKSLSPKTVGAKIAGATAALAPREDRKVRTLILLSLFAVMLLILLFRLDRNYQR